jgi:hypothetical protein
MTSICRRSLLGSIAVCLLTLSLAGSSAWAARPAKMSAKAAAKRRAAATAHKAKEKESDKASDNESASDSASSTTAASSSSDSLATKTEASSASSTSDSPLAMAPSETPEPTTSSPPASDADKTTASPDATAASVPEPVAEEPPAPAEPLPLYVEHLGPDSYPGKLRGIYGGSMWLEPSFNGLQWPYMAKSGVGVSGSVWVDSGYEKIDRELARLGNTTMWLQQGRAQLRVTPTYVNGNFFIQGQVELVGNQCQQAGGTTSSCQTFGTFDTDDLWIRFGQWNKWDVKVGRFEGWELYHTGMGLDINTMERQGAIMGPIVPGNIENAPAFYAVNYLHDRPAAGLGVGYAALHAYFSETLRAELLGELGTDDSTGAGYVYLGARPSMILDVGWLKVKAGLEYEKQAFSTQQYNANTQSKEDVPYSRIRKGAGGSVQMVFDPRVELGANFGYGKQSLTDISGNPKGQGTFSTYSVGGFANLRLAKLWILGTGLNWTTRTDSYYPNGAQTPDYAAHLQSFVALQYLLAGQLFIKAVVGYSRSDFQDADTSIPIWSNTMLSGRVRLLYLY